ncbi:HWE histidine kinase domain-containing protein [Methylocystis sp. JAN1]|uniref:HWE histidine kinase domain-containing protein n=1 Tax=Methylocystis sp. JAN1 TaxID=3397211 RepID=UPI003FA23ED7
MDLVSLYQVLSVAHIEAQGIVDTMDEPVLLLDLNLCVLRANPAFFRAFHVDAGDTVGVSLFALGNGQWDIPELRRLLGEVIPKAQAVVGFEVSHDFPSIGRRTMLVSARRMVQEDKSSATLVVAFADVTDAQKSAAETDLLLAESRHRVKNVLAVVHALAFQADVEGKTAKEYRDAFLGRLDAFLSAKDLVAQSGEVEVRLSAVVDDALHAAHSRQILVEPGPSIRLAEAHVRPIRMILHELTTNALKHGALSRPDGRVHLGWRAIGEDKDASLQMDWREERGPLVSPPDHRGFGMTMIENSAKNCGGKAQLRFDPEGLQVEILIPMGQH